MWVEKRPLTKEKACLFITQLGMRTSVEAGNVQIVSTVGVFSSWRNAGTLSFWLVLTSLVDCVP